MRSNIISKKNEFSLYREMQFGGISGSHGCEYEDDLSSATLRPVA
jgi:hypothetical protein